VAVTELAASTAGVPAGVTIMATRRRTTSVGSYGCGQHQVSPPPVPQFLLLLGVSMVMRVLLKGQQIHSKLQMKAVV
jgi:hypothetical protein